MVPLRLPRQIIFLSFITVIVPYLIYTYGISSSMRDQNSIELLKLISAVELSDNHFLSSVIYIFVYIQRSILKTFKVMHYLTSFPCQSRLRFQFSGQRNH